MLEKLLTNRKGTKRIILSKAHCKPEKQSAIRQTSQWTLKPPGTTIYKTKITNQPSKLTRASTRPHPRASTTTARHIPRYSVQPSTHSTSPSRLLAAKYQVENLADRGPLQIKERPHGQCGANKDG